MVNGFLRRSPRVTRRLKSPTVTGGLPILALLVLAACSSQNFDYLQSGQVTDWSTGGDSSGIGGTTYNGTGGTGTGGMFQSFGGTGSPGGYSSTTTATAGAGTGGASAPLGPWNFDSTADTSAWLSEPACKTTSWIADGESSPFGAMTLNAKATCEARLTIFSGAMDLSNYTLYARVRKDADSADAGSASAATADVKVFTQSIGYNWADGGVAHVGTNWTSVSMRISSPSFAVSGYDPTQIVALGLQVSTISAVSVDAVWLQK